MFLLANTSIKVVLKFFIIIFNSINIKNTKNELIYKNCIIIKTLFIWYHNHKIMHNLIYNLR